VTASQPPTPAGPGDLQFETAEFSSDSGSETLRRCQVCQAELTGEYHEAAGKMLCSTCRQAVLLAQRPAGSGVGAFLRAWLYGGLAALGGSVLWYAVAKLFKMELGLIAIVVGIAVGHAVKRGARGRGSWAFQALAIFLTYASIVTSYVPAVIDGMGKTFDEQAANEKKAAPAQTGAPATAGPPKGKDGLPDMKADLSASSRAQEKAQAEARQPQPLTAGSVLAVLFFLLVAWVIAFAAPFLAGWSNIIGIVIIGFALYEAWKISRVIPVVINGPFQLAPAAPAADTGQPPAATGT
jgi:hypothetical protein